ncbi:unnamed protein product, partial [Hydatigera taeniaeformis]|uniref:RHDF1 protein n=1 Tax=Hydatigena taeniaeformis TaxID=6205 RepID=A0A0R3WYC8_HYDTA
HGSFPYHKHNEIKISEHDAACHPKGVYKSNGSQECMGVSTEGGRQTRIPSNCAVSELNPGAQRPERLTWRNLTRSDVHSNWQQQRNKIFRNIKFTRSPSISKRFSRCEEGECKEAICYPEEDEKIAVESKKPSTFSPNEIQTAACTSQFSVRTVWPM